MVRAGSALVGQLTRRAGTPATVQPFKDGIRGARWEIFEHSSHMPHVEEQDACMRLVGDFLNQHDR